MKKRLIRILSICTLSALLATGCAVEEENSNSPETTAPTTATTETNTPSAIEEETTTPQYTYSLEDAIAEYEELFDSERLIVKEWFYIDEFGVPGWVPGIVEIDGVEYTYGYGKHGWLTSITGSDGSEITKEIVVDDAGSITLLDKEYKNGKCIDYFENLSSSPNYTGFQYEGKKYMYVFTTYNYNDIITGIKDEEGNIVAEYEYYDDNNRMGIRTINHTEDKIGDINSFKGFGYYINNDMGFGEIHNSPHQFFSLEYVFENNTIAIPLYLPGVVYGETETTSTCNEEEYITTFNPYGKEIEVLNWHGNSLNSIRPKEIIADNKKYVYEYEYYGFRSSKKVFDGDSLVEEVIYEYGRDGMDMPILKKEIHKDYEISYTWQEDLDANSWVTGFIYDGKEYFYQEGDEEYPYWVKYICNENNNKVAEYEYVENDAGIIECRVINYTEDNIGDINPIRYEEKYCDSETGIIASHSSYYYVWKNDEEIEYVVLRPYLGE